MVAEAADAHAREQPHVVAQAEVDADDEDIEGLAHVARQDDRVHLLDTSDDDVEAEQELELIVRRARVPKALDEALHARGRAVECDEQQPHEGKHAHDASEDDAKVAADHSVRFAARARRTRRLGRGLVVHEAAVLVVARRAQPAEGAAEPLRAQHV